MTSMTNKLGGRGTWLDNGSPTLVCWEERLHVGDCFEARFLPTGQNQPITPRVVWLSIGMRVVETVC